MSKTEDRWDHDWVSEVTMSVGNQKMRERLHAEGYWEVWADYSGKHFSRPGANRCSLWADASHCGADTKPPLMIVEYPARNNETNEYEWYGWDTFVKEKSDEK